MSEEPSSDQTEMYWRGDANAMQELRQQLWPLMSIDVPVKRLNRFVHMLEVGKNPRKVIFVLRDIAAISLSDAKQIVQSAPVAIPLPISELKYEDEVRTALNEAVETLNLVGAKAEVPFEEEWNVFPFPLDFLALFPHLELLPGWELIAHTYSATGESDDSFWVMSPKATPWSEQTQLWRGERPVGFHGLENALGGDRSPQSYLEASILIRDTTGRGSERDEDAWYSHHLVGEPTEENWLWIQDEVFPHDDLQPSVAISNEGNVTVTFFTVSRLNKVRLVRHRDRYRSDSYCPVSDIFYCATGGQGYVH